MNLARKIFDENHTVGLLNSENPGNRAFTCLQDNTRIFSQALNEPLLMATTHAAVTTNTKYNLWASGVKSCYPYAVLCQRKRIINDQRQVALCVRFAALFCSSTFPPTSVSVFRFCFSPLLFAFCIFFTLTQYCLFVGRSRKAQHKPPNDFAALGSCRVWGQGD